MTEKMLFHADEHGLPYYLGIGTIMRGWARALGGAVDEGCAAMREGLAAHRRAETEQQRAYYLILMADVLCGARRIDEGLRIVQEAEETVERTDERFYEAELHRIHGELLAAAGRSDAAETSLRRSIEVARTQGARAFASRTAASLAQLRDARG